MTIPSLPNQPVSPLSRVTKVTVENGESDPSVLEDDHSRYSTAIQNRDTKSLENLAVEKYGTATGDAAKNAINVLNKTTDEYNKVIKPIEQTGGLATPEGRVKFAQTYQAVKDRPFGERFMNYFVQTMSGNPKAYQELTGGNVRREITYNDKGQPIESHIDELGYPTKATNLATGQPVNPAELATSQSELKNTIARKNLEKTNEYNRDALLKNNETTNAWAAASPELKELYRNKQDLIYQIKDKGLSPEEYAFIAGITSGQSGYTQTVTAGFNALNQINENKGKHIDESLRKSASVYANMLGLTMQSDGSFTDSKGSKISNDKLKQLQDTFQKNNNYETNYSQTQQNLAKSSLYKNLKPEQQSWLAEAIDVDKRIEGKTADLLGKHGSPSFLVVPNAMALDDPLKRSELQGVQGRFNTDAIERFAEWKNKQMKLYPPDQIPNPHELEIAYTKSPEFKQLQKVYSMESQEIRKRIDNFLEKKITTPTEQVNNVTQATSPIKPIARKEPIDKNALREKFRIKE